MHVNLAVNGKPNVMVSDHHVDDACIQVLHVIMVMERVGRSASMSLMGFTINRITDLLSGQPKILR